MLAEQIRSDRLVLRCLEESDATDRYRRWMTDPDVVRYLESRPADPTIADLEQYIVDMRSSDHSYFFGIFTADDGLHRGNIKLGPISSFHGNAAIGLMIGDKEVWGRGIATEAIGALSRWAFESLVLSKLWAGSYGANRGSINAFERNGFQVEGIQRSQVQVSPDERDDVILLGKVRP